ncbi:MAG TPA: glycosyltransferase family 39 protein [Stellaceae bacterium]|nr:glycosyltransferase family 39 protein [Stellaceae bacterium]
MGEVVGVSPYALLLLLCLILYAPGLASIPPVDRDEARFAQATRQMLETGDFIRIRFQEEARNKKPIGIHWLQAATVALFSTPGSTAIWPYRLPSALAATIAVLLTSVLGATLLSSRHAGFVAGVTMASALAVVVEAHLAKTDAALLAAVVAGQLALGIVYIRVHAGEPVRWGLLAVFWIAEAAGILLKGPAAPALALLTVATLSIADRNIRWIKALRPIAGLTLATLIAAPWFVAIEQATEGRFLAESLGQDLVAKLVGPQESHGAPPGSYLALSLASFWPGSLFLVPAVVWGWRQRLLPAQRFLIAWLFPAWAFLELMPTKLPHYVLVLYPALALLVGGALAQGFRLPPAGLLRRVESILTALWGIVTIALAAALIVLPIWLGSETLFSAIMAAATLLVLALSLLLNRRRPIVSAGLIALLAAVFVLPTASVVVPGLDLLWLSRTAATLVTRHLSRPGEAVLSVGYSEPSLVFLLGTATRLATAAPADRQLAGAGMALVSDRADAAFRKSLATRGLNLSAIDRVTGLDYSGGGGRVILTLYALEPR